MIKRDIGYGIKKLLNTLTLNADGIAFNDTGRYAEIYGQDAVKNRDICNMSAGGHFDFGCGVHHPCWRNLDVNRPWKRDIFFPKGKEFNPTLDIAHDFLDMSPIPLPDSSMHLVHSRLAIEHMPNEAADIMFREVRRILKKGGTFRVIAPDINLDWSAYQLNDLSYFDWFQPNVSIEQRFLFHFAAQASELYPVKNTEKISDNEFRSVFKNRSLDKALDYCTSKCSSENQKKFRNFHMNWWNFEKLERMLKKAGFKKVYLSAAGQSRLSVLRNPAHFDNWYANRGYAKHFFYTEAVKD